MFSFKYNKRDNCLDISIPSDVRYNLNFLNDVTELIEQVEKSESKTIRCIFSKENTMDRRMTFAYLNIALKYLSRTKKVLVDYKLAKILNEKAPDSDSTKLEKIDLSNLIDGQCYMIHDDKEVDRMVHVLVDFITEKSLVMPNVNEFLVTTIGEIFSNAFNHSNNNNVYFMFDIELNDEKVNLVINITDYGNTIIHNVQEYQMNLNIEFMGDKECMEWAVKEGNTTRKGSGGYGLSTLIDYVSHVNGELLIFSGSCFYALKGTSIHILESKGVFKGTSVSMKLPLFDTTKMISYDEKKQKIVSLDLDQL